MSGAKSVTDSSLVIYPAAGGGWPVCLYSYGTMREPRAVP
jgi:hypothetical protein